MSAKYSVFNTLTHRARTVFANPQLLHKEGEHIRDALIMCKYPTWALNILIPRTTISTTTHGLTPVLGMMTSISMTPTTTRTTIVPFI